ncbi:MAG: hydroxymethylbilane synthase [Gammaproteobacteria bacterium]
MQRQTLRIVTRRSPLALWQAEHVKGLLAGRHPGLRVDLLAITTLGDQRLDAALAAIGGKGLFIKELEQRLLDGTADLAVHSMKDVTVDLPDGLALPVVLRREDPRDALISSARCASIADLPRGARVGTSSLRRQCQLRALRPDLEILALRGNVGTRLQRLDSGDFDALVLAAAGLIRLGLAERIASHLDPGVLLPAIGQGVIGIECRAGDARVLDLISPLNDPEAQCCMDTERAFNRRLGGGCHVPVAGYAELRGDRVHLTGLVGRLDGSELIRGEQAGAAAEAEAVGMALAERLLGLGAGRVLAEFAPGSVAR